MDTFYDCHSIENIYLPITTIKKDIFLIRTFTNCYSLTSIDLSNYIGRSLNAEIFQGCANLSYIDISSFDHVTTNLFKDLPKEGEIKLNKRAFNDIKDLIPEDWTIILVK